MDRPPYYNDARGAAARSSASSRDEQDPSRRTQERLPPILPSSQSLPKLPPARSDGLASLGPRLAPLKHSDPSPSPYSAQRPYPSTSDRSTAFDSARRPSSPSSMPVGLVSADYMHSRRSPGDNVAASALPPPPPPSSSSYLGQHMHHPNAYHHDALRGPGPSHVPRHMHYDAPLPHMRPINDHESSTTNAPMKRPRVSLACLACRNRKSRCDGVRPTCKTCTTMKIDCKWPEVDFRRAKSGDAARARKRSPAHASSQLSPESMELKSRQEVDAAGQMYGRFASDRGSSSTLPPSQSMSMTSIAPVAVRSANSLGSSPTLSRGSRYRTHSDGDRQARYYEPSHRASRSPTERHLPRLYPQESHAAPYARTDNHARPYSSAGVLDARGAARTSWTRDDRMHPYPQDRRMAYEQQYSAPSRAVPESRIARPSPAATRCRDRAAQVSILARPAKDAQRIAVEALLSKESNLEDLGDSITPGERLDQAFAADWDAIGGLTPAARRPFMDVAAGIVGILEISETGRAASPGADGSSRLHLLRLRSGSSALPDLRHLSVALELSPHEERELLEATSSTAYDTLSYPIPVDRLSLPLTDGIRGALEHMGSQDNEPTRTSTAPLHQAASPPPADVIPFVRHQDVKPPRPLLELFFQAYCQAVGDQMPGLETKVIRVRIQDGSISALLANALCAIGASLYERRGQRPSMEDALSSKVYVERARALIGAALQNPDLEAILALGVMAIRDILMGQMISSAVIVSSAVRLCTLLDLHRLPPASWMSSPASATEGDHGSASKIIPEDVFWMTYCLDRITSIATARPFAIKDDDVDTVFPATMRDGEPCIFAALVRELHFLGRMVEVAGRKNPAVASAAERDQVREREMAGIGVDLVAQYEALPAVLELNSANLSRAHEKRESLSFLQLHLTHNMALLHRFMLSQAALTQAEYDAMRSAASQIVEICVLAEALDATLLADTPLSAVACFLAGCVWLAEMELEEAQAVAGGGQLEAAQSKLAKLMGTLARHAEFWPVARNLLEVLKQQQAMRSASLSAAAVGTLVSQVEAIHIVVRRPGQMAKQAPVTVRKVHDLEVLRGVFPHLC